jgi:5-methylcytosine-specific restriction endonuclease McrA
MIFCLCGCEQAVKKGNKYIHGHNKPNLGKKFSEKTRNKMSIMHKGQMSGMKGKKGRTAWNKGKIGINLGKKHSFATKNKISKALIGNKNSYFTIEDLKNKHTFFSKIEELRYNPNKPEEKEIQVHCKYSECFNSKEKGGWFTPKRSQLYVRISALENSECLDGYYFYCSEKCKQECPLYRLHHDPNKKQDEITYTNSEYQTFRIFVLKRDDYICQFCGDKATEVHHERPQKLEPFFALDPDYALSCCEKCHYKKGHQDKCSTGNLARKIC